MQSAKEQAVTANEAKKSYLTGISHELRTPASIYLVTPAIAEKQNYGAP